MLDIEKKTSYFDLEPEAREILQNQSVNIEELISDLSRRLGEGQTAQACFIGSDDHLCLKVFLYF